MANATISAAFFAITALTAIPLVRARQVLANPLAAAAAAVFFGCAVGRAFEALRPVLEVATGPADVVTYGSSGFHAGWDALTACAAVMYLALRKVNAPVLTGGPLFDDLAERERVLTLEALQAESAARVEAEAERDANANMLRSIIANSQAAIYVKDLEGRYLMGNPQLAEIMGRPEAEFLGTTDTVVDEELAAVWRANDKRAEQGSYRLQEWNDAFDDGRHFYDSVKFPLHDADGQLYATCGISLDVTPQARANALAVEARDAAIAATAAKSAFLATMSHEIRTPMNAVIGMTDLLTDTDLDAEQREFVDTVRTSGDALLSVINDILDFSKIEAGELVLDPTPFDLRDEIEGCLDMVAAAAAAKQVYLLCLVDDDCPEEVLGDVARMRQILTNLLSNAVKFTGDGEVVLTVGAVPTPDDRLELTMTVTDTGIGISAAGLERLFQSFSQVDASTTRVYGGTGLGLAICQRLAEAMGGGVTVTSEPGVGSTFVARVVMAPSEGSPAGSAPGEAAELVGKRVLVVDDNATNLRILDLQLTGLGMVCQIADSPVTALQRVVAGLRYDVAVLDMEMPEMDGVELGAALRAVPGVQHAPLVLVTSVGSRRGAEDVFAGSLTKPVKAASLRDTLVAALTTCGGTGLAPSRASSRASSPDLTSSAEWRPLRILLAEDNLVNQRVTQLMLKRLGYEIDIVEDGSAAVRAVETSSYDVVLMDLQMPVMDGLEATRRIRVALPADRQPHIVAMTASALVEDREACSAAGMESYLPKPVRARDLAALLDAIEATQRPPHAALAAVTESRPS